MSVCVERISDEMRSKCAVLFFVQWNVNFLPFMCLNASKNSWIPEITGQIECDNVRMDQKPSNWWLVCTREKQTSWNPVNESTELKSSKWVEQYCEHILTLCRPSTLAHVIRIYILVSHIIKNYCHWVPLVQLIFKMELALLVYIECERKKGTH